MITMRPTPATAQDFASRLKNLRAVARPQPDLVEQVQGAILLEFAQNFETESAAGFRWAKLAERTILDRLRQGYGAGPILNRSGDYEASWTDADAADHISELEQRVGGWSLAEGSSHRLTIFHQQGTRRMPARPVNEVGASGQEKLRRVVDLWLIRLLVGR